MRIKRINIIGAFAGLLAMAGLTACNEYSLEDLHNGTFDHKSYIALTFVTPSEGTPTRSATGDPDGYEEGIEYESAIDFDGGDYKIYFFSYSSGDTNGGKLLAEFEPETITSGSPTNPAAGTESTTSYTLTGSVPEALEDVSSFRVVVLANWGTYPSVEAGTTTIDDLCEEDKESPNSTVSTYNAMVNNGVATMTSATNLIPFFGVQEYTRVSFSAGGTTKLDTPVSLLRAVAKVEIIVTEDSYVHELNTASIVNYNSAGYCAPWGVYTASGYDTSASKYPESGYWDEEWVTDLHLVTKDSEGKGINDTDNGNPNSPKTILMYKVQDYATTDADGNTLATPQLETWRAYVPEYSNMSTDYSYMTVSCNSVEEVQEGEYVPVDYNVYFAEYTDGVTTAYSTEEGEEAYRLNIKRNNLYRFYVTISPFSLYVYIDILPWVERQDDYEF